MAERDPKRDPVPGDVLLGTGIPRGYCGRVYDFKAEVLEAHRSALMGLVMVVRHTSTDTGRERERVFVTTLKSWRNNCKSSHDYTHCNVVERGPDDAPEPSFDERLRKLELLANPPPTK